MEAPASSQRILLPVRLSTIAASGREQQLVRGDVLFKEGDAADALYMVTRGRLAIAIANPRPVPAARTAAH